MTAVEEGCGPRPAWLNVAGLFPIRTTACCVWFTQRVGIAKLVPHSMVETLDDGREIFAFILKPSDTLLWLSIRLYIEANFRLREILSTVRGLLIDGSRPR